MKILLENHSPLICIININYITFMPALLVHDVLNSKSIIMHHFFLLTVTEIKTDLALMQHTSQRLPL